MPWRDHDHSAEDAVLHAFEDPTPENQHAAARAVPLLQRRYDHVLRRLDGTGELPPYPSHPHNAGEHPVVCLDAVRSGRRTAAFTPPTGALGAGTSIALRPSGPQIQTKANRQLATARLSQIVRAPTTGGGG